MKRWNLLFVKLLFCGGMAMGLVSQRAEAQQIKPVKILFLLDGSSSMLDDWQPGKPRFEAAGMLINAIVDSIQQINPNVQFALRVFGHQYTVQQNNCFDTKLEVPYGIQNKMQIEARLKYLSPRGVSPIAYALKQTAEENFGQSDRNAYSIILLTDGGESCGGNMCDVINSLLASKIAFKPYILSLIDDLDLRKEYDCFGKFLAVPGEKDIKPAIKTIIDDNRLMYERNDGALAVTKNEPKPIATPKPVEPPKPVEVPKPVAVKPIDTPASKTPILTVEPVSVKKPTVAIVGFSNKTPLRSIAYRKPSINASYKKANMPLAKIVFTEAEAIVEPPRPKVDFLNIAKPAKIKATTIRVYPEVKFSRKETKVMKIKLIEDEPKPIAVATPNPTTPTKPAPKTIPPANKPNTATKVQEESPVKQVASEKSADTKVLVYFTDGKGKYYRTEPKIDFVDVKTGKVIQSNYRTIDKRTGVPDPIKIPAGTYRITRAGSSFKSAVINVEENTTGRIDVLVNKGSIRFEYKGNPNRPVIEFSARINQSVAGGPLFTQRCDELLEYDPGQYNILINTLPPKTESLPELNFGEVTVIRIEETGKLAISNEFRGTVQLWAMIGASYQPFYDFKLNGVLADQKLDLQPGSYKVYFFKDGQEREAKFQIKSNQETAVKL